MQTHQTVPQSIGEHPEQAVNERLVLCRTKNQTVAYKFLFFLKKINKSLEV